MKITIKILTILALLAVSAVVITPAFAEEDPPQPPDKVRMSELLIAAFAAETQLTVEEVQDLRDSGMTFVQIAKDLGYSAEEVQTLMEDVSTAALALAVSEGVISEEKAAKIADREHRFRTGMRFEKFLEILDLTREELGAMFESGMTLHEIALEQGLEFGGRLATRCGLAKEDIVTQIGAGKTLKEICPGMMMPEGGWPKENPFKK
jgi:hypothetical protein